MTDQLISLETALQAKEKNFPGSGVKSAWVTTIKNPDPKYYEDLNEVGYLPSGCSYIYRPTQSLLQRWLREQHRIFIIIDPDRIDVFTTSVASEHKRSGIVAVEISSTYEFETYEEALEEGLQKALTLIEK